MAKERDWIDYVNLGSNLFQNLQLSGVQDKLRTAASVAVSEQAKAEAEDGLREVVFEADTQLRNLRAHLDDEKTGVLALAKFTLANFEMYDITSASFRRFEDKERLRSVLEGFKTIVGQCESTLSADERAEAELCARYMENPAVIATAPPELARELSKAEQEVSDLNAVANLGLSASSKFSGLFVLFGAGLMLGVLVWFLGVVQKPSNPAEYDGGLSTVVGIGMALCAIFGIAFAITSLAEFRYKRGPQGRKQLKDAAEAARLRAAKAVEIEAIQRRLNDALARERIRLEKERDALMAKVLKIGKKQASARQAAKLLGIDASKLPALAAELDVSVARIIAACLDRRPGASGEPMGPDRAEVLRMDIESARERGEPIRDCREILFAKPPASTLPGPEQRLTDAVMALMALGISQPKAQASVRRIQTKLGPQAPVEELVRACL